MKEASIFDFTELKNHVLSLMQKTSGEHAVSEAEQQKEIASLTQTLGSKRFFFVSNLENFEIEQVHGVQRWLGYSESDFTMKKYLSIVHPGSRKSLIMVGVQLYNTLCKGKFALNFMVQRYSSLIALKHYHGHYILVNKISSVFQFDKENHLTAHLDEFSIIRNYNGESLDPEFFNTMGDNEIERGGEIMKKTQEFFQKMKIFSSRELQLARKLAYEPGTTKMQAAEALNISVHTVNEYYDRFLNKSREFFHQSFAKTLDAAIFLKKEGLL